MSRVRGRVARADDERVRQNYLASKSDAQLAARANLASRRSARNIRKRMGLDALTQRGGQRDDEEHEARRQQLREHPGWTSAEHASARGISAAGWKKWRQRDRKRRAP